MLKESILSKSPEQTMEMAAKIAARNPRALVLLNGSLGAGKTLFARGFAQGLGIRCNVSSPSYTLMNEYRTGDKMMYHLDLYRINCFEEVIDIGLFEILETGNPCLIEWANKVKELNKLPHLEICIEQADAENCRKISWQIKGA